MKVDHHCALGRLMLLFLFSPSPNEIPAEWSVLWVLAEQSVLWVIATVCEQQWTQLSTFPHSKTQSTAGDCFYYSGSLELHTCSIPWHPCTHQLKLFFTLLLHTNSRHFKKAIRQHSSPALVLLQYIRSINSSVCACMWTSEGKGDWPCFSGYET